MARQSERRLPEPANKPTELEIAWFAGLFEGEGCLSGYPVPGCNYQAYRLHVRMTDEDIIQRIGALLGGCFYSEGNRTGSPNHKPTFVWNEGRRDRINEILILIYPLMGIRRKAKFDEFFACYSNRKTPSERLKSMWANQENRELFVKCLAARQRGPNGRFV